MARVISDAKKFLGIPVKDLLHHFPGRGQFTDLLEGLTTGTALFCQAMPVSTITAIEQFVLMTLEEGPRLIDVAGDGIES